MSGHERTGSHQYHDGACGMRTTTVFLWCCFTGQVPLSLIGNDAFQEVDIVGMTRSITKYGVTVRKREDLGRIIKMAFYIASHGKARTGAHRYTEGHPDGARTCRVSFQRARSVVTNRMRACMWDS